MKTYLILFAFALLIALSSCSGNKKHTNDFNQLQRSLVSADSSLINAEEATLAVYYFHNTRRCVTCNAVETVAKESLVEFYGDKVKFSSLNIEDEANNQLAKDLKVTGQALIVKYGSKQFDLTNEAFMYARKSPEKLKLKLKSTIDPFL